MQGLGLAGLEVEGSGLRTQGFESCVVWFGLRFRNLEGLAGKTRLAGKTKPTGQLHQPHRHCRGLKAINRNPDLADQQS